MRATPHTEVYNKQSSEDDTVLQQSESEGAKEIAVNCEYVE